MAIAIDRLDHLVLTVHDVDRTIEFYRRVLGMEPVTFAGGRRALAFGDQKINLHRAGHEFEPRAARPTPGSAGPSLLSTAGPAAVVAGLEAAGVPIEEGPVQRTGARGEMTSVYFR